jgi:hypothetical protein
MIANCLILTKAYKMHKKPTLGQIRPQSHINNIICLCDITFCITISRTLQTISEIDLIRIGGNSLF